MNEYPGIIRFHVIANSDSEEDQELKLGVRDYVLPKIEEGIVKELKKSREQVGGQQGGSGRRGTGKADPCDEEVCARKP